jgi:endonuclease-8
MPEGPEVHRMAKKLARVLVDRPLTDLELRHPAIAAHEARLRQHTITSVTSRGKAFLLRFGSKGTLYVHLQLYGRWRIHRLTTEPRTNRTLRVALVTDSHQALLYSATDLEVLSDEGLARHRYLSRLGPDLFDPDVTPEHLCDRVQDKAFAGRQLASLMLDQGFVGGIGNYLRAEMLFVAGIHPGRRGKDLHATEALALGRSILDIGQRALDQNGTTTDAELQAVAERRQWSRRRVRHYVFERDGQPCFVCGTGIERADLGGRRMFWCPSCQV